MKPITIVIPVGLALVLAGCAGPRMAAQLDAMDTRLTAQEKSIGDYEKRLEEQKQRLSLQEKRLSEQERGNEALKKELAASKKELDAVVAAKVDEALKQPRVQAEIQKAVEQNVARRMEELRRRRADERRGEGDERRGAGEDRGRRWEEMRAQFRAKREERERQEMQKFAEELELNEDQQARVNDHAAEIREKISATLQQLREGNLNMEDIKAAVEDMKLRNDAAMKDILTPQQYEEFKKKPNPIDAAYEFLTRARGQGGWRRGGRGRRDRDQE